MRRSLSIGAFALLSLSILAALSLPAWAQAPTSRQSAGDRTGPSWTAADKIVAAYYFYWYDIYTNLHFRDPDGSDALTDHPPDDYLPNFSYKEVSWHRRELLDMIAAKIDVVLPVYWGSNAEIYWSKPGLQNLVTALQSLIAEGHAPPKVGMFYDTTALRQQNGGTNPNLATPSGKALFYGMMADFFHLVPASLWAAISGRPLVYLYTTEFVGFYDQSTFDYVAQHFQAEFGTTPYIVREASWQGVDTDGMYYWGVALNGPATSGSVGSIGPGYDETAVYGRPNPRSRDRECGEFYNAAWQAMTDAGVTLVSIETWNELHEGTDICASREYGRTYIDLTARNVQRWKMSDYSATPLVWLDLGQNTYRQGLRPAFNFGDGTWLVTHLAGREAAYPDHSNTPVSYHIYLDVNNAFMSASAGEVWVTVEYYDGDGDDWFLQYDGVNDRYAVTEHVQLGNSGQWQRHTFHLPDAYFGGRQNGGADLRLVDGYDGATNYFGRVWVSKMPPANQAPDLASLNSVWLVAGDVANIPIAASDPDGSGLVLTLDQAPGFVALIDNGDGTGFLHLTPGTTDVRSCSYSLTVLATDTSSLPLADAVTFQITVASYLHRVLLPMVLSG